MGTRDQHVDGRHHEQRERRAYGHAGDQHHADAVARPGARASREDQRQVSHHRGGGGHQNRAQPR